MNHDPTAVFYPYQTVWEQKFFDDESAIVSFSKKNTAHYQHLLEPEYIQAVVKKLDKAKNIIEPKSADTFDFVSIGQVIDLLNDVFTQQGYRYIEVSRRVDSLMNGADYHFVVRMALIIPDLEYCVIREGYESFSNKGFKQGFRGMLVTEAELGTVVDLTPEGVLSLWKNAEADAKKRCVVDLGVGSQFLPDPAENKKHGKKGKKGEGTIQDASATLEIDSTTDEGEPVKIIDPVIESGDDTVDRTEALLNLKKQMKRLKIKSPAVYELCTTVIGREVTKMKEFTKNELEALTLHLSVK